MSPPLITLRHREKVLAHAEQQLRSQGELNAADLLSLYKKFLKIENHRIRLKHYSGGGGREICAQRASLVDIVLRHLLEAGMEDVEGGKPLPKLALVALGGYGRGELNPFSDVDIMFLHDDGMKQLDPRLNDIVQHILYMLWDVGFKVGHSTRSISDAIKHANEDMLSKTALLEARFIAGDEALFEKFRTAFVDKCVAPCVEQYITQRVENQAERHEKYGRTVYLQEPNIKNGCGGLRDYQNLLWISFFKERVQTTAGLVEKKLLNEAERRQLDRAYDFLLRIRTELHYLNKRSTDVIIMSQQVQIANKLNYPQKNILRRSEAFMRDYYQQARTIYSITELISERLSLSTTRSQKRNGLLGLLRKPKSVKGEEFDGFYSQDGLIYADSSNVFNQEPARMMRLFQHMQQRQLDLSPELAQLVRRRLHLVDRTFQYAPLHARNVSRDLLPQGPGRQSVSRHARGRFPRALHSGIRTAHLPRAARVFPPLYRRRAHPRLRGKARYAGRYDRAPLRGSTGSSCRSWKTRRCFIWPCSCTTRAKRPMPASTPRPAPSLPKKSPGACNSPPSSANRSC